jgi:NTE family protein
MQRKDLTLVLSGSGTKFYAFLGAIRELVRAGYSFNAFRGTSGGAIVAAAMAFYYDGTVASVEKAIDLAVNIPLNKAKDRRWFSDMLWPWGGPKGRFKGKRILKLLRQNLPPDFDDLRWPCAVSAFQVNLARKRTIMLESGDLPLAVRASMSIPGVFDPVTIGSKLLVDGGWQFNLPLPADGTPFIALSIGDPQGGDQYIDISNTFALFGALVDGALDASMMAAIQRAADDFGGDPKKVPIIPLRSGLDGLDFNMSRETKLKGVETGAESARKWIQEMS